ncbi:hypothetical protein SBOR_6023 [Sclerotinia borealis F-4128]|uniref:Uncharacterized protein n=1 Tax=Sclerotinia borealis (strain F-4128) TaxID=1432307 RepID=W9CFP9_SCLBF|nr:hypothetical protein SBOR_6023 [Sclerotinia borealis F-4128]
MPNSRFNPSVAFRPMKSVVSASFLYPFKGIWYFCADRQFYPLFGKRLIPLTITSIVVLGLLFTFTYLPQVAFLAIWNGPGAWFNAAFLVLGEGQILIALLFEALLVDEALVDVFDATLIKEGLIDLVSPSRLLHHDAPNEVKMLGKPTTSAIYSPFSFRQIAEFIIFLPLNFIPVVGTPAFLILTGARAGPLHHWRYFKLRGLTKKERKRETNSRKWNYTWFGTVALLLQLIPVLSMFFLLTSAVGSALWVVKLEEQKRLNVADTLVNNAGLPDNREIDEEARPAYTDDLI